MVPGVDAVIPLESRARAVARAALASRRRAPGRRALRSGGAAAQLVHGGLDRGEGRHPRALGLRHGPARPLADAAVAPAVAVRCIRPTTTWRSPRRRAARRRRAWRGSSCRTRARDARGAAAAERGRLSWCWRRAPPTAAPSSGRPNASRALARDAVARRAASPSVLVGAGGDAGGRRRDAPALARHARGRRDRAAALVDLMGKTDLATLAAVLGARAGRGRQRLGRDAPGRRRRRAGRGHLRADQRAPDRAAPAGARRAAAASGHPRTCGAGRVCCGSARSGTCACAACRRMTSRPDPMTSVPPPAIASRCIHVGLRPAVFLDRDGTMNEDVGYLSELSHLTLYPWAIDAVRLLNRAGYLVVVVTNQGGIGRGDDPARVRRRAARRDRPAARRRRRARRRLVSLPASSRGARRGVARRLPVPQAGARHGARRARATSASTRRARG